eukprot:TCONS_00058240-protein
MITDEAEHETVLGFNIDLNSDLGFQEDDEENFISQDEQMPYQDNDGNLVASGDYCGETDSSVYQELAEKDHYLMLAAEAGKVLLEKNQELSDQYSRLQEEYLHKIEALEQERHHLKRELHERDYNYESRMQDLHHELGHLRGQLSNVQKASKTHEQSSKSHLQDLNYQNNSLVQELDEVKAYNAELANQVQTLSKRIDGRLSNGASASNTKRNSGIFPDYDMQDGRLSHETEEDRMDYEEMKRLREKVQRLAEEKRLLESSLTEVVQEKTVVHAEHQSTVNKMSVLENEVLTLKQQVGIYQEDLTKTKKKNNKLKDKLEEVSVLQAHNQTPPTNTSLFSELEMSMSEADMNLHHQNNVSTPLKHQMSDDEDVPDIFVTTPNNRDLNRISSELREVYLKLISLKHKLKDEDDSARTDNGEDYDVITADMVSRLVDQIIHLIQERILSLGIIDPRTESPRLGSENGDETCSLPDSRHSDTEVELLEQQLVELNQLLNEKNTECEDKKKELHALQATVVVQEEKADILEVKANKQEREIEALRSERDLLLSDKTMEEKLKQVLEERDEAIKRANDLQAHEEQHTSDMKKLNNQLISAVQQKLELSEQLEEWQFDMASLIDQQLTSQIKNEQKRSRKRTNSGSQQQQQQQQQKVKSYLTRFFSRKNSNANSKEPSRTNTPNLQSPVPPK